jgi:hypothetical protein
LGYAGELAHPQKCLQNLQVPRMASRTGIQEYRRILQSSGERLLTF